MATGGRACGLHPWTHVFCFFSESESFFFPGNSPEEPSPELPEELVAGAGCGGGGGASGLPCLPYRRKQEQGQRQEQTEARVRVGCRGLAGGLGSTREGDEGFETPRRAGGRHLHHLLLLPLRNPIVALAVVGTQLILHVVALVLALVLVVRSDRALLLRWGDRRGCPCTGGRQGGVRAASPRARHGLGL
jgi:hypothetical protein